MLGLNKKNIGIDIADNTIEVAEIKGNKILNLSRIKIPSGIVQHNQIKDEEKLILAIKKVLENNKPKPIKAKEIIFKLQESQSFVFTIKIENKNKLQETLKQEIKNNVPLEKDDLVYNYKIINKNKNNTEILIIAVSREVLKNWHDFFKKLKIKIKYFDIEAFANYRALFNKSNKEPICIVDIGSQTTSIALFNKNGLCYSYNIQKAGQSFTKDIANKLNIDLAKAEEKKIASNLQNKNKIEKIIIESLQPVISEINSSIKYLESQSKQEIKKIILVGGSSQLKGLSKYLSDNLKLEVKIGSPVLRSGNIRLVYLGVIGSAMKISKQNKNLIFKFKKTEKTEKKVLIKKQEIPIANNNPKIKILFIILILGIVLIAGAFWYRNYNKSKLEEVKKQAQEVEIIIPDTDKQETATTTAEIYLLIKETPIGFLNVRKGPGTSFEIITQVNPGKKYLQIDEDINWYQIEINKELEGWIYAKYVDKLE